MKIKKNLETKQSKFIGSLQSFENREVAFKKLVSLYKEGLYWHVSKIVIDHGDANDVVQNNFIEAYLNRYKFKGQSFIYNWVYPITNNENLQEHCFRYCFRS